MRSLSTCGPAVMILALLAMLLVIPAADGGTPLDMVMAEIGPAPFGLEAPAPMGLTFNMSLEHLATESVQPFTADNPEPLVALLGERYGDLPGDPTPGRYRPG